MTLFYLVLAVAVSVVILTWLILRSGHKYSVHDTEAHSTSYADVIKEGHGGLTLFLWISFITIFVWTIVYLVQHASEFSEIFNIQG
jgi:Ca2+/Na+ antiporter